MATPIVDSDQDDLSHTVKGGLVTDVTFNGKAVAVKSSTMDDGVAISSGVIDSITINGQPLAVSGSTTEIHKTNKKGIGTLQAGAGAGIEVK